MVMLPEGSPGGSLSYLPRQHRPTSRPNVRYISARDEGSVVCESVRFLWNVISEAQAALPATSKVVVGLSGGTTPRKIFSILGRLGDRSFVKKILSPASRSSANIPLIDAIDWTRVVMFLVDERYVPADHEHSNQRMMRETLLKNACSWAQDHLIFPNTDLPIEECVRDYQERLVAIFTEYGRPTLVTLGLGDDGHVASWFPPLTPKEYQRATSPDAIVHHTTQDRGLPVEDRITVSLSVLLHAATKVFFFTGQSKIDKWNSLLKMNPALHAQQQPALQILGTHGVTVISYPPVKVPGSATPPDQIQSEADAYAAPLSVVVFGASGDLAMRKTLPALFSLFCDGFLPDRFRIFGYARSKMTDEEFCDKISPSLIKLEKHFLEHRKLGRLFFKDPDASLLETFTERLEYVTGTYDKEESFATLNERLEAFERGGPGASPGPVRANRLFYLALPSQTFASVTALARRCCWSPRGWNRVVVEKPFGRDLRSAMDLAQAMLKEIKEEETYRIDHYLGKEMVLNLLVLRYGNSIFAPLFSWTHVSSIRVTFKEEIGVVGRGGYFDQYGIIRDIMQNHLLQIMTILAMERPASLHDDDIRDEKVKVLKQIRPICSEEVVVGQYVRSKDGKEAGYSEDPTVPDGSKCPTFCVAVLRVDNERWAGVPFILKAGKALDERSTEIRIQFRASPGSLFGPDVPRNELVIKVQPSESVYLKILAKRPGLEQGLEQVELDLSMMDRFDLNRLPDAYERLILDVIKGDKQNFVRTDELLEAWRIFTPLLHELESENGRAPLPYPYGSAGPQEAYDLVNRVGFVRQEGYTWR